MFNQRKRFDINEHEVIDFVRLLGRVGLKFQISDRLCAISETEPEKKTYFRRFYVFGTRRELSELFEMRDILKNYHLH